MKRSQNGAKSKWARSLKNHFSYVMYCLDAALTCEYESNKAGNHYLIPLQWPRKWVTTATAKLMWVKGISVTINGWIFGEHSSFNIINYSTFLM